LLTKTPATTQSELFAEFRCIFTRFTGTGILPTILSLIALDDNNGLIMRRPNTGSAAGSKPNVGNLGASVFFDSLLFTTCSSKSTIFDLIDLKKSLNVPAAFCASPESVPPSTSFFFVSTKRNDVNERVSGLIVASTLACGLNSRNYLVRRRRSSAAPQPDCLGLRRPGTRRELSSLRRPCS